MSATTNVNVINAASVAGPVEGTPDADLILGTMGGDSIDAGAGHDTVKGANGDDTIAAGPDDDTIKGGLGDDLFIAGSGNNRYIGNQGNDTIRYAGVLEDYDFLLRGKNLTTVTRADRAPEGAGVDLIALVEEIQFANGESVFLDGRNNGPFGRDDAGTATEGGSTTFAVADLLANDIDVDRDTLSLLSVSATSAGGATVTFDGSNVIYDAAGAFDGLAAGETTVDSFTYIVSDGRGGTDTVTVTVTVTGVNDAPVIVAPNAVEIAENTDVVATVTATDVDGDALTFAISGGADAALFEVDADTGALSFIEAPDFEAPADAGGDNTYDVIVSVTDGTETDEQAIAVTVTDVAEGTPVNVTISEIMYDPNSPEDNWEWVEIVNTGSAVLDLAGWVIDDANSVFQGAANIAGGTIAAGGAAVLYNADDVSAADFEAAWGPGINLIAVTGWSAMGLNNTGDTVTLWDSFDAYSGDQLIRANAVASVDYSASGFPDPVGASIYLADLSADPSVGANWATSTVGGATPVGIGEVSVAAAGNTGTDVGSPGGAPAAPQALVINEFVGSTTGSDVEFIELFGEPGTSLAGLSILVVESDVGTSTGVIDARFDLPEDAVIGENGFYLIGNNLVSAQYGVTPDAEIAQNFIENSSYTLALVETSGAGAVGDQAGSETVIDSVGVSDGGAEDTFAFGAPVIGPEGVFLPAGGVRIVDGVDTDTPEDFAFADFGLTGNTPTASAGDDPEPEPTARLISEVQGSGTASALAGQTVTVTAIVVGDFQNGDADATRNLGGFWLQEEVEDSDGNSATSEGIFVFEGTGVSSLLTDVSLGDRVTVTGKVSEFFGATQITASSVTVTEAGAVADVNSLAVDVSLAANEGVQDLGGGSYVADLEAYEGMLVNITDTLTVIETFELDRFNQVVLSADGRPEQFTQTNAPDAAGFDAFQRQIAADQIVFDDGLGIQNQPIFAEADLNGDGVFDTSDGFGMGDTANGVTGILDYSFDAFRVRGVEDGVNSFVDTQTREDVPDVGGVLTVSSFNVLNFFSTIDTTGAGSGPNLLDPRGADSVAEFDRQLEKLLTTLAAIDADIFGLVELENEFGTDQNGDGLIAIEVIVDGLNDLYGAEIWASVDPGRGFVDTGDAISVGMIYRTTSVALMEGSVEILDDSDLDALGFGALDDDGTGVFDGTDSNRAPLLADFLDLDSGEVFSVAVTHMKSKGGIGSGDDADQGDGAGAFNAIRNEGVQVLTEWLAQEADDDVLVLGDFNAYAREQPIDTMKAAGFTNLEEVFNPGASSYVFDGQTGTLDYAFASTGLAGSVTGASAWHINSDEPDVYDYDLDFSRDPAIFDGETPYRTSDHDPLVIGLDFGAPDPLMLA
ncbi:MAG: ExeM/NucH family extracellular endonuclease [Jannaschia sp.]